ncbi:MAG: TonB-dependent receptor domain-containing protein, partial [Vicinamibacterales bacterium]
DDEGIEPNNYGQNFSGHVNLNVAPSDKLDLGTSLHFTRGSAHLGVDGGLSSMLGISIGHPLLFASNRGFGFTPPEVPQQLYDNVQDINRFTGGATLNHRPASWFAHRLTLGLDYTSDDSRLLERYAPPELRPFVAAIAGAAAGDGRIGQTLRNHSYITGDYSGTATFSLTPSISSASSIGGQFVRKQLKSSFLAGLRFPGPGVETVSGTTVPQTPTQSLTVNTTLGVYGQQQFGWNDRLFLTAGLRVDNNSAFGEELDWVTYPKVGASWVISEEPFWGGLGNVVNTLKLRTAYGQSGQQPDAFVALRTVVNAPRADGTPGVTPGSLGNPDLKPERGTELEVGFEAGLFDRLSVDFTYFTKRTKDAILN